jgi:hypothetical protein
MLVFTEVIFWLLATLTNVASSDFGLRIENSVPGFRFV